MSKYLIILLLFVGHFANGQERLFVNGYKHTVIPPAGIMDTATSRYVAQLATAGYTATALDDTLLDSITNKIHGKVPCHGTTMNVSSIVKIIYPVMGSTATQQGINLANVNYGVIWNGTFTRITGYYTGDGSTGYGNTGFVPSGNLSAGQGMLMAYVVSPTSSAGIVIGDDPPLTYKDVLVVSSTAGSTRGNMCDPNNAVTYSSGASTGVYAVSATSSSSLKLYEQGTPVTTYSGTRTTTHAAFSYYLSAQNNKGVADTYCNNTIGFIIVADGATDAQVAHITNIVNDFITQETGHAK